MDAISGSMLMFSSALGIAFSRSLAWPRRYRSALTALAVLVILSALLIGKSDPLRLLLVFLQVPIVSLAIAGWAKTRRQAR